ncbi:hypothetical protein SSX86_006417 [Deinandra increscens subsp. villosa]|uniref:Transmembrane protein n=1 Tax=Deinandra increscens subsp. villosa TaxID=3103831 RepID=A0AAP0DMP2_9ASTR
MSDGSSGENKRQRYNNHDYSSGGDDLEEDDACSIPHDPQSLFSRQPEHGLRMLFGLLPQVSSLQMCVGLFGFFFIFGYFLYAGVLALDVEKSRGDWETSTTTYGLTFVTIVGFVSLYLLCFALWAIWSFFTLPLVFTLLMASMVILSYLVMSRQSSSDLLRIN